MKRVFLILLGLLTETELQANAPVDNFHYYVGLNANIRYTNKHPKLSRGILPVPINQIGIMSGFLFNEHFGIELGYETSFGSDDHILISKVDYLPANRLNIRGSISEKYEINNALYSGSLGIVVYSPFYSSGKIFISGGISYLNFSSSIKYFCVDLDAVARDSINFNKYRQFKTERIVPYIKSGIQFSISDNANIRLFVDWKDARNSDIEPVRITTDIGFVYKDTFGYGIGLVYAW